MRQTVFNVAGLGCVLGPWTKYSVGIIQSRIPVAVTRVMQANSNTKSSGRSRRWVRIRMVVRTMAIKIAIPNKVAMVPFSTSASLLDGRIQIHTLNVGSSILPAISATQSVGVYRNPTTIL